MRSLLNFDLLTHSFTGGNIWIPVSYIRSIYNILVYIWPGIFGDDYGLYCQVSCVGSFLFDTPLDVYVYNFVHFRGLKSKHITRLEHQLSENIRSTQNRIWNGVQKDVSYLRRILNEVYMMKFKVGCCEYVILMFFF